MHQGNSNIYRLNADFGISGQLEFVEDRGGFPMARIDNGRASALVSVYAGQVLSYQPLNAAHDLLFVSDAAYFQAGRAIKGGIPVCWPWFGPDPENRGRPAHGFVRSRPWSVRATGTTEEGDTRITLGLEHDNDTLHIWPSEFDLSLTVIVGDTLTVNLCTRNTGERSFVITQALHSYFKVGSIEQVQVTGLDGSDYLDKAGDGNRHTQAGPVRFDSEVDRIYLDVAPELLIEDTTLGRRISITSSGSRTAVVWNPWEEISVNMGDLKDDDFKRFVCVETANAADDRIAIEAGAEYCLGAEYRLTSI